MFEEFLVGNAFAFVLVFTRIGAAAMLIPGIGEVFVPVRSRLALALLISLLALPLVDTLLPARPAEPLSLAILLLGELILGLFIGTMARLFISALASAGMVIAYSTSLANALTNDPTAAQQGSLAGNFLTVTALMLIFALDLHHMLIQAVIDSYTLFRPGAPLPVGELSDAITRVVAHTFLLAVKISAPFVAVSLVFYLGMGLLGRLMPQMQVFFVAMPLQIAMGLVLLALALPVMMQVFLGDFEMIFRGALPV